MSRFTPSIAVWSAMIGLVGASPSVGQVPERSEAAPTFAEIERAWHRYQSQFKSVDATMRMTTRVPSYRSQPNALSREQAIDYLPKGENWLVEVDHQQQTDARLMFDDTGSYYLNYDADQWSIKAQAMVKSRFCYLRREGRTDECNHTPSEVTYGTRILDSTPPHMATALPCVRGMMVPLRSLRRDYFPYSLQPRDSVRIIANQDRRIFTVRIAGRPDMEVDSTRDYLPVRLVSRGEGDMVQQECRIVYSQQEQAIWVPVSWSVKSYHPDGRLWREYDVLVKHLKLNEAIPLPADCDCGRRAFVIDNRDGLNRSAVEQDGVIRYRGKIEPIENVESYFDQMFDDLEAPRRRARIWIVLAGILGLLVLGTVVFRRRTVRRRLMLS